MIWHIQQKGIKCYMMHLPRLSCIAYIDSFTLIQLSTVYCCDNSEEKIVMNTPSEFSLVLVCSLEWSHHNSDAFWHKSNI